METQRKASALSCSLSTTSCFPLGPALMRDHVFLENESNKSLFSMEFTLCVIRQSPVQTKRLKPSGGKETDLESSISRGKLAVMSARLSSGNVLGAQRVLSSPGELSVCRSSALHLQDPGAGDGGSVQGGRPWNPAQLCRRVAVSNTEQLQRLALLDGKGRGVLQNLEGFGGREGQRQRDGLGKAGTSLLLRCPH